MEPRQAFAVQLEAAAAAAAAASPRSASGSLATEGSTTSAGPPFGLPPVAPGGVGATPVVAAAAAAVAAAVAGQQRGVAVSHRIDTSVDKDEDDNDMMAMAAQVRASRPSHLLTCPPTCPPWWPIHFHPFPDRELGWVTFASPHTTGKMPNVLVHSSWLLPPFSPSPYPRRHSTLHPLSADRQLVPHAGQRSGRPIPGGPGQHRVAGVRCREVPEGLQGAPGGRSGGFLFWEASQGGGYGGGARDCHDFLLETAYCTRRELCRAMR